MIQKKPILKETIKILPARTLDRTFGYRFLGCFIEVFYLEENGFWYKDLFVSFNSIKKIVIKNYVAVPGYYEIYPYFIMRLYFNDTQCLKLNSWTLVRKNANWLLEFDQPKMAYRDFEGIVLSKTHCEVVRIGIGSWYSWYNGDQVEDLKVIGIIFLFMFVAVSIFVWCVFAGIIKLF